MNYRDGYVIDTDTIRAMSVDEMESVIIRVAKDRYLSENAMQDILKLYLEERKLKLDKAFECTEEDVKKISEYNDLLIRQSTEAVRLAMRTYKDELELMPQEGEEGEYNELTVKADLIIPDAWNMRERFNELNDEKEYELWEVLSSPYKNRKLDFFPILNYGSDIRRGEADEEKILVETLYGTDGNGEKLTSWAVMMQNIDWDKLDGIYVVWPLHNLYDYCNLSMSDIFKIKELDYKITVEYENY